MRVAILGATGKTGRYLVLRLCADGHAVVAIGRSPARLATLDPRAETAIADLERPATLAPVLAGAACVVSLAHARFTEALLAALPASCGRVVLTGSTRGFSALPDAAADAVRAGAAAFAASGRTGVMLHPSMIYGAPEERNVNRVLALIRRWPRWLPLLLPLPDGGRHRVQPVFVDDVVAAFAAAITGAEACGPPIVLAGPAPIAYAHLVRACAGSLGRRAHILPLPVALLVGLARVLRGLGLSPPFGPEELRRAAEDKDFDVTPMRRRLGVSPRPFEDGLARILNDR